MRITIVQGAFLPVPPLRGGAVEKVWFALGREMARRGHEVVHISRSLPGLENRNEEAGVRYLRVRGHDAPAKLWALKLLDLAYSLRVRCRLPAADILVTNTFWLPMLVRNRKHGALYVHVQRYPRGQMKFYRHAARLQTVSPALAEAIRERVPDCSEKVRMIPNPLLDNVHASEPELERERRREFLFVGRIHPEKGLDLLLRAFARYAERASDPWRLAVVGPWETNLGGGGEDYFNRLRASIPPACERQVEWAGFVADAAGLKNRLLEAGLFLYPTIAAKGEASPVAPLEAMGCGCPVLVSDLDCFRGLIEDGETGFVFNPSAADPTEELARRLGELAADPVLRKRVGKTGWHRAETLALEKIADLYLKDFASVLG